MAMFDSAPPILSSRLPAWRSRPGCGGTPRTIVSPAVITSRFSANCDLSPTSSMTRTHLALPVRSEQPKMRPDARPELVHGCRVRAELLIGVLRELPEVCRPVFQPFADHAVDLRGEVERAVEEVERLLAPHNRVVGREEMAGTQGVELADGVLVTGGVEVARRLQEVAFPVVDALLQRGVYDDGRVVLRVPEAKVARRVTGEVQELDPPVGPQPQELAAAQAHVHRGIAVKFPADPIFGLLVGAEAVRLGPEVDLRHYPPGALHPRPVGLATREPELRVHLLEGTVAAAMVDVGVAYDHLVHVLDAEPDLPQVGDDDLLGRPCKARVDEDRSLLPDEQVLAHEPLPEVRLDAVYPRQYLHPILLESHWWHHITTTRVPRNDAEIVLGCVCEERRIDHHVSIPSSDRYRPSLGAGRTLPSAGLHAGAAARYAWRGCPKLPGGSGYRRAGRRRAPAADRAGTRGLGQRGDLPAEQGGPRAGVDGRRRLREGLRRRAARALLQGFRMAGRRTRGQGARPRRQPLERARARARSGRQQPDGDRGLHSGQRRILTGHRGRESSVSSASQSLRRLLLFRARHRALRP